MKFVDFYNTLTTEEITSLESCLPKNVFQSPRSEGLEVYDWDDQLLAVLPPGDEDVLYRFLDSQESLTVCRHVIWESDPAKIEALGELEDVIREHVYGFVLKKWNSGSPPSPSIRLLNALERVGAVYKTETINTYTETVTSYKLTNSEGAMQ